MRSHVHFVRERTCETLHAVDYVELCFDAWALGGVLFKGDFGSSAQVLIDEMQVERSEEAVVEESPMCLYQSGSEAEDTVQRIESLTRTRTRVLREKLGRKVDTLACTHCAEMGETENDVQEYSTGHGPRLARQTALDAATAHGETRVRQELIAHLSCVSIGEEHAVLNAEEEYGDSSVRYQYFLVATPDVLSNSLVTPESFPVESTRVLFLVSTV